MKNHVAFNRGKAIHAGTKYRKGKTRSVCKGRVSFDYLLKKR